jgi:hypothetical protein
MLEQQFFGALRGFQRFRIQVSVLIESDQHNPHVAGFEGNDCIRMCAIPISSNTTLIVFRNPTEPNFNVAFIRPFAKHIKNGTM